MKACGTTESCDYCTKKNRCDRRGYSTDDRNWGKRESYFPDLWAIEWEKEMEEKRFRDAFKNLSW